MIGITFASLVKNQHEEAVWDVFYRQKGTTKERSAGRIKRPVGGERIPEHLIG